MEACASEALACEQCIFYCYIIANTAGRTYNGYTNNLKRRLRQHNGEIKGGAKATSGKGPWKFIAIMTSHEWTAVRAMQNEWSIKYPTRRRPRPREFQGPLGRIMSFKNVCEFIPEDVNLFVATPYFNAASGLGLPDTIHLTELLDLPK